MELSKERFTNNFDFLRLLAACCIAFTHSFNLLNRTDEEPLIRLTYGRFDFSYIGLCIFFSISGYLIAKSALRSTSIISYFWRRFLRIQPLLIIVCLLSVLIIGPWLSKLEVKEYFSQLSTWTYFRNVFPATGIQYNLPGVFVGNVAEPGVNGSLWTLVVEERLYLFTGFFLLLFKAKGRLAYTVAVLLLNLAYVLQNGFLHLDQFRYLEQVHVFYALLFLNAGLAAVLSLLTAKVTKPLYLLLVTLFSIVLLFYNEVAVLRVMVFPIAILIYAHLRGITNHSGRWGDFTYGIYIFAFPVQQILIHFKTTGEPLILFTQTMAIVIPLAVLSWHFIERRCLALKHKY